MNERVNEYAPPRSNWFKDHPSASLTIVVAVFGGMQWAGVHLRKDIDQPQWDKVHKQMAASDGNLRRIGRYVLAQGSHTDSTLALIARAAGVKGIKKPPELERAERRVIEIAEND